MTFEEQWLHWLRVSKPAADALRRAHNKNIMDAELGIRRARVFNLDALPDELGESVVRTEDGRATALRTMLEKSDENWRYFKDRFKPEEEG